jgi:hypothetical protein
MLAQSILPMHWFRIVLVASFVLAYFSWAVPARQMSINIHAVLWWSIPLVFLWIVTVAVAAHCFRQKAQWMFFGAPPALYWPVWLALPVFQRAHRHGNCV